MGSYIISGCLLQEFSSHRITDMIQFLSSVSVGVFVFLFVCFCLCVCVFVCLCVSLGCLAKTGEAGKEKVISNR